VLLSCKQGGKYTKYKHDLDVTIIGTRKYDCPSKLRGKHVSNGKGWVLKVICGTHNHTLAETLVGHSYAERLKLDEHVLVVDMMKSQLRLANILLNLKENNWTM